MLLLFFALVTATLCEILRQGGGCPEGDSVVHGTATVSLEAPSASVTDQEVSVGIYDRDGPVITMGMFPADDAGLDIHVWPGGEPTAVYNDCTFTNWVRASGG